MRSIYIYDVVFFLFPFKFFSKPPRDWWIWINGFFMLERLISEVVVIAWKQMKLIANTLHTHTQIHICDVTKLSTLENGDHRSKHVLHRWTHWYIDWSVFCIVPIHQQKKTQFQFCNDFKSGSIFIDTVKKYYRFT